jgi:preprotein translocase subunit SecY
LLQAPLTFAGLSPDSLFSEIFSAVFGPGGWLYNTTYAVLIIFFAFFYTSITFKPDDIAENLKKNGGFVPGIRPGARTAEYFERISARLTLSGSIYLAAICVLPTILTGRFNVQFYFGGTSLLIVVGVALETFRQIDAHRQSLRYETYMKSAGTGSGIRPRGRG